MDTSLLLFHESSKQYLSWLQCWHLKLRISQILQWLRNYPSSSLSNRPSRHQGQRLHPYSRLGQNFCSHPWPFSFSHTSHPNHSWIWLILPSIHIPNLATFHHFYCSHLVHGAAIARLNWQQPSNYPPYFWFCPTILSQQPGWAFKILCQAPLLPSPKPPQWLLLFLRIKSKSLTLISRPYIICIPLTSSPTARPC